MIFTRKIVIILVAIVMCLTGCSNEETSSIPEQVVKGLNEKVEIEASYGNYTLTIKSVAESTKRNDFAETQPKRIIIVEYDYENIDCTENITISYLYFHAYDSEGNLLNIYPSTEVKNSNLISAGGKTSASMAYGLESETDKIKLEFYNIDYSSMNKPVCTFDLEW